METQLRALREERNLGVDNMDDSSQTYGGVKDPYKEDTASQNQKVTPWVRVVVSGVELLRNPRLNKGTAFSNEERDNHHLRGLVPSAHMTEERQVERIMQIFRRCKDPMEKYVYMMGLQERNERLFYKVLVDHVTEVLPIVYTPTVGEACQKYGVVFRRPHGLYININDRGKIFDILQNWPETDVEVIVVTDGERILGLGDLGLQGMGIPVGKLSLYTALGGIRPSACLPITIDVGTNNKELLKDSTYLGLPHLRVSGQDYYDLIDEFMIAVKRTYGEKVLIQFEDFANENAFFFLAKYASTHLTFNDDIQGTAAVVLAGIHAALSITGANLADQKFLFNGAGEAGIGIAEMIAHQVSKQGNISLEDARKNIWMVDSKGLITKSRYDSLSLFKKIYAQEQQECRTLLEATKALKPSILVGTSGQKGTFTREVLEAVASFNRRPVIFALSNPTSKSECTAEEAYTHTEGRGIFASGSPFDPLEYNGEIFVPGQANNAYIFPGFGLGCVISGAIRIHDDMFLAASEALGKFVSERELDHGLVYPPFDRIRDVSAHIAAAVAEKAYELGLATRLPQPKDLAKYAYSRMYSPDYHSYR